MRYEGKNKNAKNVDIYTFTVGKEELELILLTMRNNYEHTPPVFDNMAYRGRLRNIVKTLGKVLVEEIKGKTLPTKYTRRFYEKMGKLVH